MTQKYRPGNIVLLVLLCAPLFACTGLRSGAPEATGYGGYYKVGSPYQINGVWYYPKEDSRYDATGIASWYGPNFHGKKTANGEIFDQNAISAAHPTLPMPVLARVTSLENGRSIVVRINDRGPFAKGREIDLSRRAAEILGFRKKGTAKVRVQFVSRAPLHVNSPAKTASEPETFIMPAPRTTDLAPAVSVQPVQPVQSAALGAAVPPVATDPESLRAPFRNNNRIFIQTGAFSSLDNAQAVQKKISAFGPVTLMPVKVDGMELYRVRIGPLKTAEAANALLGTLSSKGYPGARIIVD